MTRKQTVQIEPFQAHIHVKYYITKNTVPLYYKDQSKTNQLTLSRFIVAVYSKNYPKHINTLSAQNAVLIFKCGI